MLHYCSEKKSFIETIKAILSTPIDKHIDDIYGKTKSENAKRYINTFFSLDDKLLSGIYAELCRHITVFVSDKELMRCLSQSEIFTLMI